MVGQNLVFPQILSSLSPVLPPSISSHCQDLSFITPWYHGQSEHAGKLYLHYL